MRLWGALLLFVAVPLLLAACGDEGDDSDGGDVDGLVLDEAKLEGSDGIQKILVASYRIKDLEGIDCPGDQKVAKGNKFTCTVTIGGDEPKVMAVEVTVTDDAGTYQVGPPKLAT